MAMPREIPCIAMNIVPSHYERLLVSWRPHFKPDERFSVTRTYHVRWSNTAMPREQVRLHRDVISF